MESEGEEGGGYLHFISSQLLRSYGMRMEQTEAEFGFLNKGNFRGAGAEANVTERLNVSGSPLRKQDIICRVSRFPTSDYTLNSILILSMITML